MFGGVNYDGWNCFTGRMRTEEEWRWGLENFRRRLWTCAGAGAQQIASQRYLEFSDISPFPVGGLVGRVQPL